MLLTQEQMGRLKRRNASNDTEKTKERVRADFGSASAATKRAIAEACGQVLNSIQRIYKDGTITTKVALAMASELDVTPFYYTGAVDEKEPCTDALIKQFLTSTGYADIAAELDGKPPAKAKRAYNRRKPKKEANVNTNTENGALETPDTLTKPPMTDDEINAAVEHDLAIMKENWTDESDKQEIPFDLSEDEAVYLLKALFIRAKAGGNAAADLDAIKKRLLSI